MKETKYRAWDGEKMIYDGDKIFPSYFDTDLKFVTKPCQVFHNQIQVWVHETQLPDATDKHFDHISYIPAKEFMQFTGLKDNNDKEIYEGDWCKMAPLGFTYKECNARQDLWIYGQAEIESTRGLVIGCIPFNFKAVIIGNIFEDPNLLT